MCRVQHSGCMRKNQRTCAHPSVGAAGPSATARARSSNIPEFSTLLLCAHAGRLPVECNPFVPDVVQSSPSNVRDSALPTQHDAIDSWRFCDFTLTQPHPPPTSGTVKISVCPLPCAPRVRRVDSFERRDVPSASQSKHGQRGERLRRPSTFLGVGPQTPSTLYTSLGWGPQTPGNLYTSFGGGPQTSY